MRIFAPCTAIILSSTIEGGGAAIRGEDAGLGEGTCAGDGRFAAPDQRSECDRLNPGSSALSLHSYVLYVYLSPLIAADQMRQA